jgi:hypothetical protein
MGHHRMLAVGGTAAADRDERPVIDSQIRLRRRAECLEQLLLAFADIADRDDIHQAAARLEAVQAWIRQEAQYAAYDPLLA